MQEISGTIRITGEHRMYATKGRLGNENDRTDESVNKSIKETGELLIRFPNFKLGT